MELFEIDDFVSWKTTYDEKDEEEIAVAILKKLCGNGPFRVTSVTPIPNRKHPQRLQLVDPHNNHVSIFGSSQISGCWFAKVKAPSI